MANKTFDFGALKFSSYDLNLLQTRLDEEALRQVFGIDWGKGLSVTSLFTIPTSRSPMPSLHHPSGWHPQPGRVLKWLFTIAAPHGCPECQNSTEGAWTVYELPQRMAHVLKCDACGWQHEITTDVIANFVTGKFEDPRDFDLCACGTKKRKPLPHCPTCAEALRWDTCACRQPKLKIDTQCGDCREAARWDTCACGQRKLKPSAHCDTCCKIELAVGPILTIETGGFLLCLRP